MRLWMRHETRSTERRAPVVPSDARRLVRHGIDVTVESSPQRAFPAEAYAEAGCAIAEPGSWPGAPPDAYVLGLKELPGEPTALVHRHVFFGHAYKGQSGAGALLRRFADGGGELLDLEYLTDADGRRLAAFGYWAGYTGAALALLHWHARLPSPLRPLSKAALDAQLRDAASGHDDASEHGDDSAGQAPQPAAIVIGALGRSGRGAQAAFATAGVDPTCWDIEETRTIDRATLLRHDVLVNAVLTTAPTPPFVTTADVANPARTLATIADVTCDSTSEYNVLPIYRDNTTWQRPANRLHDEPPLDIIAIDNLPSLLPVESSTAFSAELTPQLMTLGATDPAWKRCAAAFHAALDRRSGG